MTNFRELGSSLSNWGRWGDDDERGTANFVTPALIVAAARLIRRGVVVDLGLPFDDNLPQTGQNRRFNPVHLMSVAGGQRSPDGLQSADDVIIMPLQCGTQWDALSHIWYDDRLYNGYDASTTVTSGGATRNSIAALAASLVGRGVLVDLARWAGVDSLEPSHEITPSELNAALASQHVEIGEGDILLIRTGHWSRYARDGDKHMWARRSPGIGLDCCTWLADKRVSAVAADLNAVEATPFPDGTRAPVHLVCVRDMGLTFGEMFYLDELTLRCAEYGTWEFFFAGPPLKIPGAVGSPINPVAVL